MKTNNKVKIYLKKIRYQVRDLTVNRRNRERLRNKNFTIISNDCTGGTIYHDLQMRFDSPTVNLYIGANDYIKFVSNLQYYLALDMEPTQQNKYDYPCARLGDIVLHLVHYNSVEEASECWNIRKKRIHVDNIFFIMNDRNGCTERDLEMFMALPFPNKLFYTAHSEWKKKFPEVCWLKCFSQEPSVGIMTAYRGLTVKRYYDFFDYVSWLNCEK